MKKLLKLIICGGLLLCISGCGKEDEEKYLGKYKPAVSRLDYASIINLKSEGSCDYVTVIEVPNPNYTNRPYSSKTTSKDAVATYCEYKYNKSEQSVTITENSRGYNEKHKCTFSDDFSTLTCPPMFKSESEHVLTKQDDLNWESKINK